MDFSLEDIQHLADLARIRVEEEKKEAYKEQIGSILEYVEKLQELDTGDVDEFAHAAAGANVFRQDEVQKCDSDTRKRMIAEFPNKEGDLLEVQAVFEERTE